MSAEASQSTAEQKTSFHSPTVTAALRTAHLSCAEFASVENASYGSHGRFVSRGVEVPAIASAMIRLRGLITTDLGAGDRMSRAGAPALSVRTLLRGHEP